jgi:hypothetical protein
MADMDAFERDLRVEVRKLPPRLIAILKDLAQEFGPTLDKLFQPMFESLGPHIRALMVEGAMGLLDKQGLSDLLTKVLREEAGD